MADQDPDIVTQAEAAREALSQVRETICSVVFGQTQVIELTLSALLSGGHALLVGAPGLAKTRLVETIGTVIGLSTNRIQFTPDLMPGDILGSEVLDQSATGERSFRFIKGPVFTSLLMADEINRASPRTQSALLQAMQERQVTIAGKPYDLPVPFHVLATQNPIEQEGTYPLPEAQLDRFLLKIDVPYPDPETERQILIETTSNQTQSMTACLNPGQLMNMQLLVRDMPVGEKVLETILALIRAARPETTENKSVLEYVEWGPSPRAGQALMLACRARALLRGRLAPSLEDVEVLAGPCLSHRMGLRYATMGDTPPIETLINQLTQACMA